MRGLQERGPVPAVGDRRRGRLLLTGAVAVAVVVADQVTKTLALHHLADGPVHLFWTLRFNLSFNSGAAFGLGRGLGPVLVAIAIGVLVVLLGLGRVAMARPLAALALGLLLGGAVGNLIDRLVRDHGGAVVDFIDLRWWPIFNVADMAITVGAILLVLVSREPQSRQP
ncbi:MAG TPA: signal peptidase II [Acidimicrobiales bacterium]|nr:signal peptidase II [Acidimicrobiales bacterium]